IPSFERSTPRFRVGRARDTTVGLNRAGEGPSARLSFLCLFPAGFFGGSPEVVLLVVTDGASVGGMVDGNTAVELVVIERTDLSAAGTGKQQQLLALPGLSPQNAEPGVRNEAHERTLASLVVGNAI